MTGLLLTRYFSPLKWSQWPYVCQWRRVPSCNADIAPRMKMSELQIETEGVCYESVMLRDTAA
jgi:hypothetical protein